MLQSLHPRSPIDRQLSAATVTAAAVVFSTRFHPILYLRCSPLRLLSPLPSYLATYPRHCRIAAISRSPISLSHTTRTPSITVACPRRGRAQPLPIRRHGVRVDATRINEIHGGGFSADRPSRAIYTATGRDSVSFSGLFIQRVAAGKETFEESTRRKREKKRRSEDAERSGGRGNLGGVWKRPTMQKLFYHPRLKPSLLGYSLCLLSSSHTVTYVSVLSHVLFFLRFLSFSLPFAT